MWKNTVQEIYTYDANNNQTSYLYERWNDNKWGNYRKYKYAYDDNNNQTYYLWQDWHDTVWMNIVQYMYTYDAGNNRITSLNQEWKNGYWKNTVKEINSYDANNNQTGNFIQIWYGNTWVDKVQQTYTYDVNDFMISVAKRWWNGSGTELAGCDSTHNYFHTNVGINDLISQDKRINVFPNPTSGTFSISCNTSISAIEICNLFGERIYSDFKFNQQTTIDLLCRIKGIYLVKIYIGKKIYCRKIVVQ